VIELRQALDLQPRVWILCARGLLDPALFTLHQEFLETFPEAAPLLRRMLQYSCLDKPVRTPYYCTDMHTTHVNAPQAPPNRTEAAGNMLRFPNRKHRYTRKLETIMQDWG
jgi:hypothetical protein